MSSEYERELKDMLLEQNFYVVRAAGSHGLDLVALAPHHPPTEWAPNTGIIIEEKSTRKNVFYVKDKEQWFEAMRLARAGRVVFYAIRWKSGARANRWEFFTVSGQEKPSPMRRGHGFTFDQFLRGDA